MVLIVKENMNFRHMPENLHPWNCWIHLIFMAKFSKGHYWVIPLKAMDFRPLTISTKKPAYESFTKISDFTVTL